MACYNETIIIILLNILLNSLLLLIIVVCQLQWIIRGDRRLLHNAALIYKSRLPPRLPSLYDDDDDDYDDHDHDDDDDDGDDDVTIVLNIEYDDKIHLANS